MITVQLIFRAIGLLLLLTPVVAKKIKNQIVVIPAKNVLMELSQLIQLLLHIVNVLAITAVKMDYYLKIILAVVKILLKKPV